MLAQMLVLCVGGDLLGKGCGPLESLEAQYNLCDLSIALS